MIELTKEEIAALLQISAALRNWQGGREDVKQFIAAQESAEAKLREELKRTTDQAEQRRDT